MQKSLYIRIPLIISFILIYGVNSVRLISRKENIKEPTLKQNKKHQQVFLHAITFDLSQEESAEVFTSFALISHLSTIILSKIGVL